jgi:hypothetical protein
VTEAAGQGQNLIALDAAGTAVFVVTALAATIHPRGFDVVALVVALVLFALGVVIFLMAYATAIGRSREHEIGIGGLYFLAGTAPRAIAVRLLGLLGLQVVLAIATAAARPYTSLAFGVLVPVFGLGCSGLWGARYGRFGPRLAPSPARRGKERPLPSDRSAQPGEPGAPGEQGVSNRANSSPPPVRRRSPKASP